MKDCNIQEKWAAMLITLLVHVVGIWYNSEIFCDNET